MALAIATANLGSTNPSGGSSATVVLTTVATVAAGGTVVLVGFGGQNVTGIVDDSGLGNTWTYDRDDANGPVVFIASCYCPSGLPSGTNITLTYSSAVGTRMVQALSYTGGATSARLDQTNSRLAFGEGAPWTSSSITPSTSPTIVFGVYAGAGESGQSSTPDAGWTEFADMQGANNPNDWFTAVYQIVSDTSARNPSGTLALNTGVPDQVAVTANYKEGVGGGGAAPANTVAPAVTGNKWRTQTLACSTGTWTGDPTITYAYQWQRDGVNISGATASTRVLSAADVGHSIRCVVTASNGTGSVSANSNAIVAGELYFAAVADPIVLICGNTIGSYTPGDGPVGGPECTVAPVASGIPVVGQTLSTTNGTWTGATSFSYQWQRSATGVSGWVSIPGANAATYVVQIADTDQYLRAAVIAS